jgi:2-polyprenyl-3-methyl-5-hydroxy-6-metoxy-1,4-benzoquinol methylase
MSEIQQRIRTQLAQPSEVFTNTSRYSAASEFHEVDEATSALVSASSTFGQPPPSPPTFRGRAGAFAVRVVARMLFWYTPQLRAFHRLVAESAKRQASFLRVLGTRTSVFQERFEAAEERFITGRRQLDAEVESLNANLLGALARIETLEETVAALKISREKDLQSDVVPSLQADVREIQKRLNDTELLSRNLKVHADLQERRLAALLGGARNVTATAGLSETVEQEIQHLFDATYLSFEDRFRGTREEIKQRLRVHLERLVQAGREMMNPVLDIGCGRGEWLELLSEAGFAARGIDLNRAMILSCRERGLDVTETDALTYMRTLPDTSTGAVTGFHIVEHLPFEEVIQILDEAVRILKPGGIAIFETPNPANLMVGANTFYYDPTHRNPLPAPTLAFLGESRGFSHTETVLLHPNPASDQIRDSSEAVQRLNDYLYGPRDYAFVGIKSQ